MSVFIRFLWIAITALLLSSCEGDTSYTTRVNNYSSEAISIQIFSIYSEEPEFVLLAPGKSHTLFVSSSPGVNEAIPECSAELDSVKVILLSGKHLLKDMLDANEWVHRMNRVKGKREVDHYCDFDIYPKDLQ